MKKNEIMLLLVVFGILALVLSWQLIYKNNQTKTQEIEAQNVELQQTVDRLEILNAKKPEYIEATELMKTSDDLIIDSFASGVRIEDQVMYLYNMELVDANDVRVPNVSLQAAQVVPYAGTLTTEEGYELQDEGIGMYRLETTVGMTTTNNGLKNVLNYIYGMDSRKSVTGVTLTTGQDGYLTGNMKLDFFYLTGTDVPYVDQNISGVSTGTTNIFGVLNGSAVQPVGTEGEAADAEGETADAEGED
ncbi:MAG: hypothetical protein HDR09_19255 [Lachnospiraceae bacterium]|nr:hypothetical protein [Lachnospiraceae bacterium]